VDAATATEPNPEEALQAARNLAMRQAALLIEFDNRGLGVRSQLGSGGAEGIGGLQAMTPLNPTAALTALADMDVELPVDGLARDLDLELLGDMGLVERPAAVGADVGQGRLVDLIDLIGAGRLAVGFGAVVLAGLASWLLGLVGGLALGEGSGLALAGTEGRVELVPQAVVFGLQVIDPSLEGLTVGTPDRFHAGIIRDCPRCSRGGRSSVSSCGACPWCCLYPSDSRREVSYAAQLPVPC
jgi:hypothetical protein